MIKKIWNPSNKREEVENCTTSNFESLGGNILIFRTPAERKIAQSISFISKLFFSFAPLIFLPLTYLSSSLFLLSMIAPDDEI